MPELMDANKIPFAKWYETMEEVALEHELYEMMQYIEADGRRLDQLWERAKGQEAMWWRMLVDGAARRLDWEGSEVRTLL